MTLARPEILLVLLLLPLLIWSRWRQPPGAPQPYPSLDLIPSGRRTWRRLLLPLPGLCRYAALAFLTIALARPQVRTTEQRLEREGIAIDLVVDISSSMDMHVTHEDGTATRLDVAKQVLEQFVTGDGEALSGRENDLIGIITFARYADTLCPLTLGHRGVVHLLRRLRTHDRPELDGTAYGDAAVLAAAHLKTLESTPDGPDVASKAIVLLTDGENNCGTFLPMQAANLAAEWGIRIYTISLQQAPLLSVMAENDARFLLPPSPSSSDDVLADMATATGGIFRTAHDRQSLHAVYREIDALEKTALKTVEYTHLGERYELFAGTGLAFLVVGHLLSATCLRVAP